METSHPTGIHFASGEAVFRYRWSALNSPASAGCGEIVVEKKTSGKGEARGGIDVGNECKGRLKNRTEEYCKK